jgi:beta-exotoxin I transport system ATP-binding protein
MTDAVSARKLTKSFGRRRGVIDVDLNVRSGEVFGFLGPNGAGKSTTIRLLLGLYRPTSGDVAVLGRDPLVDGIAMRAQVGYLPGELALFPRLTGREHLEWFSRARAMRSTAYRDKLVERFAAELDRPVHALSKGNRQKIGIVLAFMHRPELLVLDEPTSGLDPLLQEEFARLLRETVADGRTVFLSSHELDEVQRVADRVAIIKEGVIVVTDSVEKLRRNAPRTVEFTFERVVDPAAFSHVDGVRLVEHVDHRIRLAISGAIGPLLRVAADLEPVDMTARAADLEELFLTYYRDDARTAGAAR